MLGANLRIVVVAGCSLLACACQQNQPSKQQKKEPIQITEIMIGEDQIRDRFTLSGLSFRPQSVGDEVWVAFEMFDPAEFLVAERTTGSRELKPKGRLSISSGGAVIAQSTDVKYRQWDGPHFNGWGSPLNMGITRGRVIDQERYERTRTFNESHIEIRFVPGASQDYNVEFVHTLEPGELGFRKYRLRVYQLRDSK